MAEETYVPRLKARYREEIKDALHKEFKYENVMQIAGLENRQGSQVHRPVQAA